MIIKYLLSIITTLNSFLKIPSYSTIGPIAEQKNPAYQHRISDQTLFKIHPFPFLQPLLLSPKEGSEVHCVME